MCINCDGNQCNNEPILERLDLVERRLDLVHEYLKCLKEMSNNLDLRISAARKLISAQSKVDSLNAQKHTLKTHTESLNQIYCIHKEIVDIKTFLNALSNEKTINEGGD